MVEGYGTGRALKIKSAAPPADGAELGLLVDFLEFIDHGRGLPLRELLRRALLKARHITDAEAGSIFFMRGRGAQRRLEAGDLQNDVFDLEKQRIVLPLTTHSIAGYVALTSDTLFIDDLYAIEGRPFTFNRDVDTHLGYQSRTML